MREKSIKLEMTGIEREREKYIGRGDEKEGGGGERE